jgi:starvation-inducible DNA-binding protein
MSVNRLGFPVKETNELITELNVLLANFQIYYQNLRGIHWNIRGKRFFELHLKFEELYNDTQLKVDLVAERILTLGGVPLHTFTDYLQYNKLEVGKNISKDIEAVNIIINSLSVLLQLERSILNKASEISDEGTTSMMSDFIQEQEKTLWMLDAWLQD